MIEIKSIPVGIITQERLTTEHPTSLSQEDLNQLQVLETYHNRTQEGPLILHKLSGWEKVTRGLCLLCRQIPLSRDLNPLGQEDLPLKEL